MEKDKAPPESSKPEKPQKLTPAEKKRLQRASKTVEEKEEERQKNAARNAKKRAMETDEQKEEERVKNQTRLAKKRTMQTEEQKEEERNKNCLRIEKLREVQTEEQKHEERTKNCIRIERLREAQTEEQKEEERKRNFIRQSKARTKVEHKEALRSQEILDGSFVVKDLKETDDTIGMMDNACNHCGALKFKRETGSSCCGNGKVSLTPFPRPPEQIEKLWHGDTQEGRLFRQHSRPLNNALCLTSIKAKNTKLWGKFHSKCHL